jgi:predicted transposase
MTTLFLCLSLLGATPAFAEEPGDDDAAAAEMMPGHFDEIAAKLGLSEEQKSKVSDIVYASRSAKVDIDGRAEKAKIELKRLMMADPIDEKAVMKALDTLNAAEGDLRKNKIQLMLSIRKELTADQWKQLVAMRKDMREERRERRSGHDE